MVIERKSCIMNTECNRRREGILIDFRSRISSFFFFVLLQVFTCVCVCVVILLNKAEVQRDRKVTQFDFKISMTCVGSGGKETFWAPRCFVNAGPFFQKHPTLSWLGYLESFKQDFKRTCK